MNKSWRESFENLPFFQHLCEKVNDEVHAALLRRAEHDAFPEERMNATNSVVSWLKENKSLSVLEAQILTSELNNGFLLLDTNDHATVYEFGSDSKQKEPDKDIASQDPINTDQRNIDTEHIDQTETDQANTNETKNDKTNENTEDKTEQLNSQTSAQHDNLSQIDPFEQELIDVEKELLGVKIEK